MRSENTILGKRNAVAASVRCIRFGESRMSDDQHDAMRSVAWQRDLPIHGRQERPAPGRDDDLLTRLLHWHEAERRATADEWHDDTGQTLAALKMELSSILAVQTDADAAKRLRQCIDALGQLLRRMRRSVDALAPPLLDSYGLPSALDWFVVTRMPSCEVSIRPHGYSLDQRLEYGLETVILRLVQEALLAAADRQARVIQVDLHFDPRRLLICLRDDGAGPSTIDEADCAETKLLTLKERVRMLGGAVYQALSPVLGTVLTIDLGLTGLGAPTSKREDKAET